MNNLQFIDKLNVLFYCLQGDLGPLGQAGANGERGKTVNEL